MQPRREDMHVHSTFSDGRSTLAENVAEAEAMGLSRLGCVDHVRRDTDWVPAYAAAVGELRDATGVALQCGIEAKLLDTGGDLDLPASFDGIDAIYAADHQVPLADGPHHPREVRAALDAGALRARDVLEALVGATAAAVERHDGVVIAHLFSVLPKIGLDEADVPLDLVDGLAEAAARAGARVEIDERWRCPGARTLGPFARHGVEILLSTDSHRRETIGRYEFCHAVLGEL